MSVKPVPEPSALGGTAVAGLLGIWLKRKRTAS
ncbi:PEP-CTERM sorting domain-containing protein [Nostoc sp. 'Peltigera malacea cyanobiont' DB3992]|nr:PEP-CTERM sorting domain-containing protein [Nostoc sp. 'Peltigera malacea cyanobiont' DB3992]